MRRRENDMLWNTQHERNRANHIISSGLSHSFLHLFVLLALKPPCKRMRHCWILHVASICTPCYILLSFVGSCWAKFENGQTFDPATPNISFVPWSPMRSATMLDLFAQLFPILLGPCSQTRQLHLVSNISSPRCTAGPKIWELFHLHTIAHTEGSNNSLLRPFARNVSRLQKFFRQIQLVFANTPYES